MRTSISAAGKRQSLNPRTPNWLRYLTFNQAAKARVGSNPIRGTIIRP